jgi:putative inorganic carbon (HCO3(-)) transporter
MTVMNPPMHFTPAHAVERKPRVTWMTGLLMAWAALLPYQYQGAAEMISYSASDIILVLIAVLEFPNLRYRRELWSPWQYALLALFAVSTLTVAIREGSLQRYVYLNKDIGLLILFLAYAFLTSAAKNWHTIRMVMRAFVVSVVAQNIVGVLAWVASTRLGIGSPFVADNGLRLAGLMGDANAYGGLVATTLVICQGACSSGEPLFRKKFLIFARLTLAAGLLVSFSRTSWISLAIVFLFLLFTRFATAIRALFLLLCGFAVTMVVMGRQFLSLFEHLAFRPEVDTGAGRTRFDLVSSGLADFVHHPFFGIGVGSFYEQQQTIIHNSPIWFLTEFGVIGFTIFAGFLLSFALRARAAYRLAPRSEKPVVFGLILGMILMTSMSLGIEAFYQRHWWLTFALIASSYSVARRERRPRLVFPPRFASSFRSAIHG